jgi:hypothetical protein
MTSEVLEAGSTGCHALSPCQPRHGPTTNTSFVRAFSPPATLPSPGAQGQDATLQCDELGIFSCMASSDAHVPGHTTREVDFRASELDILPRHVSQQHQKHFVQLGMATTVAALHDDDSCPPSLLPTKVLNCSYFH